VIFNSARLVRFGEELHEPVRSEEPRHEVHTEAVPA
jgi:hypothetical protein